MNPICWFQGVSAPSAPVCNAGLIGVWSLSQCYPPKLKEGEGYPDGPQQPPPVRGLYHSAFVPKVLDFS